MKKVTKNQFLKLMSCLVDNGIEPDEAGIVAEACCYVLDLDPETAINELED